MTYKLVTFPQPQGAAHLRLCRRVEDPPQVGDVHPQVQDDQAARLARNAGIGQGGDHDQDISGKS